MENKFGIENLKKVLHMVIALANLGDDVGRDTSMARWGKLLSIFSIVKDAPGIKVEDIKNEISELDPAEREALLADVAAELKLEDAKLEMAIKEGLAVVSELAAVIERSVKLAKELKGA